jgi:hypothetical protein
VALSSGLFDFFTLEQVQAIHARAAQLLIEGKTVMSWSSEGKSGGKQFTMPVDQVLAECNARLRQLTGPAMIRRTKADFSRGIQ